MYLFYDVIYQAPDGKICRSLSECSGSDCLEALLMWRKEHKGCTVLKIDLGI